MIVELIIQGAGLGNEDFRTDLHFTDYIKGGKGDKGDAFTFEDFTPEQIEVLQQPATEAAEESRKVSNEISDVEEKRATAEQNRVTAEGTRKDNEAKRVTTERTRVESEAGRIDKEKERVSAETSRASAEQNRTLAEDSRRQEHSVALKESGAATTKADSAAEHATEVAAGIDGRMTEAETEMFQLRTVEMPLKADLDPVAKTVPSAQIEPLQGLQTGVDCSKGYLGGTSAQYPNLCFAGDRTTRLIFTYDNTLTYNTVQTVFSLGPYRENINMYIGANLGTMNIAAGGIATSVKLNNGINLIVISTKFNSKISRIFFNGVFIAEHLSTTLVAPTQFAIGNFGAGYAENFINKMINSVTSFNYAMSDTECLALWNNGDPLNYMLPNNMKHPVYVVDDPFVFEAQSNSSASYPIANSVESDTNGFLGQYRKATRLPEGTTTHNIISVYFKPYLYQVFSSFMTHTPMQVVMRYRSNVKFDTKLNNPIGINVPHNLADPLEITLNVCNVLNTNLAGFISTGAIMDDSPTAWIEYQIVSVKSMNCIAEYLPCGLLTDKWRDTSGNGNDIAAVGTPELVYQRPAYVTVDKGLRALFVARGAVWNEKTGFYELNGLTDITERQMMDIFIVTGDYKMTSLYWNGIFSSPTPNYPRTNYPVTPQNADRISCELAFYKNIQLEVLNLVNTGTHEIRWAQSSYNCFLQCTKLHTILGVINANSTTNFTNSFNGCNDLQNIDIKNLKASISFLHSQSLTRGSILYLINNSINTTPITATLHANAKERLTPEDIALASSKNITIA